MALTLIIYMAKGKFGNNASFMGIFEIFPKVIPLSLESRVP